MKYVKLNRRGIYRICVLFAMIYLTSAFIAMNNSHAQLQDSSKFDQEDYSEQSEDESRKKEKEYEMPLIIVTSDRTEKELTDIPLPASIVSDKDIEENVFVSMADLLSDTPGFSQVYEHHSPLLLRGSTTSKLLILKNGNRLMGSMPQGFMGQNINLYDIDRVEIIRGPASVIYGSGANTGIINIIDRDIFEEEGVNVRVGGAFGSNNLERITLARFHWNPGLFALQLNGRYRKSDNMHYGGGSEAENSFYEDKDAAFRCGYKMNDKNRIILESSLHNGGPWGKPLGFNDKPEEKKYMRANNENENTYHLAGYYNGKGIGIFEDVSLSAYYDYETRDYHKRKYTTTGKPSSHTVVNYEDKYGGGHLLGTIMAGGHFISLGCDGYIFRIWSPEETEDYINDISSSNEGSQGGGISSVGAFAQDHWEIIRKFNLMAGLRYDTAKIAEGDNPIGDKSRNEERRALSGNGGLIYNPARLSSLTFNIGRAFRMPDALDMYYERVTCGGTARGNPDLKPEYSWNIDVGYRGRHKGFKWDVAIFSNYYYDLIVRVPIEDDQILVNREKARITGGEGIASYTFKDILAEGMSIRPGISIAGYRGDDFTEEGNAWDIFSSGEPIYGIPPVRVKMFVRYILTRGAYNCFFEVQADHSMKKEGLPEEESELPWSNEDVDACTIYGITTGIMLYDLWGLKSLKLNIRIQNLLDEKYYAFGSYIYGKGRDVKVFLSAEF